ncbi:MAG TPA: PspC domain-containing protein [Bacteroidales bacterium]|nr:PspC domain-containing protein [Bacteroidales bacterium]
MKKTIKVNIGGTVFHLDEDAYARMKEYLDSLSRRFGTSPTGKEIMEDIELRIAELLNKQLKGRECVSLDDVREVTEILGAPEDFEGEEAGEPSEKDETGRRAKPIRRLYRDIDHGVFGGVCAGLGAYFNVDPLLFRILFVAFLIAYGSTAIIYLIFWLVVPPARTMAQKLEMAGKPVTVDNIENALREEWDAIRENVKKMDVPSWGRRVVLFLEEVVRVVLVFLGKLLQFLAILAGGFFILLGSLLLIVALWTFFVQKPLYTGVFDDMRFRLSDLTTIFFPSTDPVILAIGVGLFIGIPIMAMLYWGIKLVFRFKTENKAIGITATIAWVFSLCLLLMIGLTEAQDYQRTGTQEERYLLDTLHESTYILAVDTSGMAEIKRNAIYLEKDQFGLYYKQDEKRFIGRPFLDIVRSEDGKAYLVVTKEVQGRSEKEAGETVRKIDYAWSVKGNRITLGSSFYLPSGIQWKGARVNVKLYLPEGKKVYIPETAMNVLNYYEQCESFSRREIVGKTWEMEESGLCNPEQETGF